MTTNMLEVCLFASITLAIKASTWAKLLSKAWGVEVSKQDLLRTAERVISLERMINTRLGFNHKDDTSPKRFLTEPAPDGRGAGQVVDLETTLNSYYQAMGWDSKAGLSMLEKFQSLGLGFVMTQ